VCVITLIFAALVAVGSATSGYIGCYSTGGQTSFPGASRTFSMTVDLCQQTCQAQNNYYAYIFNATTCICSDSYYGNSGSCNLHDSNGAQAGGAESWSVYASGKTMGSFAPSICIDTPSFVNSTSITSPNNSPAFCTNYCGKLGSAFGVVSNGNTCTCAESFNGHIDGFSGACGTTACSGLYTAACGDATHYHVYQTGYWGCIQDQANPRYLSTLQMSGTVTVESCRQACFDSHNGNFDQIEMYAGVQDGDQCFCGTLSRITADFSNNARCNSRCTGDHDAYCGAPWYSNVYGATIIHSTYYHTEPSDYTVL